jgi:hypothetical protein
VHPCLRLIGRRGIGFGELQEKNLHQLRLSSTMAMFSDIAPLLESIVVEPVHLPCQCLICLCGWLGSVQPGVGVDVLAVVPDSRLLLVALRCVLSVSFNGLTISAIFFIN